MDTAQFLARISPPGNFIAVGYDRGAGEKQFSNEFFEGGDYSSAAGLLRWAARKEFNAYHAMASFKVAEPRGKNALGGTRYRGERKIANAQMLKAFWIDLDIKRDGDKKHDNNVYPDPAAAIAWVAQFRRDHNLPRPNLGVNSGYGIHIYWVLEDALPVEEWLTYAHAFKAAMVASGFKGDPGISADAARVLRPPGTVNVKVTGSPMPVDAISALSGPDAVNSIMLGALQPFVGKAEPAKAARTVVGSTSVLAQGGAQVANIFQARVAAHKGGGVLPNMTAAATANLPESAPKSFALIEQQCGQVAHSLTHHGLDDNRSVWYLGHLTLAHFCSDGSQFVHAISDGHPGYKQADTDAAVAQIAAEVAAKQNGPPKCAFYEQHRPAVCQACPHHGRITSPIELGLPQSDLPAEYRRNNGRIEVSSLTPQGNLRWDRVVAGDVSDPLLFRVDRDIELCFTYSRLDKRETVRVLRSTLPDEPARLRALFANQGVNVMPGDERRMRDFVMAWIDKLIAARARTHVQGHAWGWQEQGAGITGFAVGGKVYRHDGSEGEVGHPDTALLRAYTPQGTLEAWREAYDFVCKDKPALQALVASAFGAPLMKLTGFNGVIISGWGGSGTGKSSAMTVAQGVWADSSVMCSINDTANSSLAKIAATRSMPAIWDEVRNVSPDDTKEFVRMVFQITQGKERGRMRADTSLREVRMWETLLVCAANRPLMDQVIAQDESTEAGALRVFEFKIELPEIPTSGAAQVMVKQAARNYGCAGEVFARHIAANADPIQLQLVRVMDALAQKLGAVQNERFYVAAMAVMLVGADLATKLGICQFDMKGLGELLCSTFSTLRAARKRDLMVHAKGYDLDILFAGFMSQHAGRRLVTNRFPGMGGKGVKIHWRPQETRQGILAHVSVDEAKLRFERTPFYAYCRAKNLSGPDVVCAMQREWGAREGRWSLGGGTPYGTGQTYCIEIPLVRPELADYLAFGNENHYPHTADPDTKPEDKVRSNPGAKILRRNGLPNVEQAQTP